VRINRIAAGIALACVCLCMGAAVSASEPSILLPKGEPVVYLLKKPVPYNTGSANPFRATSIPSGTIIKVISYYQNEGNYFCAELDVNGCGSGRSGLVASQSFGRDSAERADILDSAKLRGFYGIFGCDLSNYWRQEQTELYTIKHNAQRLYPVDSAFILGYPTNPRLLEFEVTAPVPAYAYWTSSQNPIVSIIPVGSWIEIGRGNSAPGDDSTIYNEWYIVRAYAGEAWVKRTRHLTEPTSMDTSRMSVEVCVRSRDLSKSFGQMNRNTQVQLQQEYIHEKIVNWRMSLGDLKPPLEFWDSLNAEAAIRKWKVHD
jgi:hypothetical protein